jgi:TM2 domain-containing membrane protein YozV
LYNYVIIFNISSDVNIPRQELLKALKQNKANDTNSKGNPELDELIKKAVDMLNTPEGQIFIAHAERSAWTIFTNGAAAFVSGLWAGLCNILSNPIVRAIVVIILLLVAAFVICSFIWGVGPVVQFVLAGISSLASFIVPALAPVAEIAGMVIDMLGVTAGGAGIAIIGSSISIMSRQ